jgi:hypothetical protein
MILLESFFLGDVEEGFFTLTLQLSATGYKHNLESSTCTYAYLKGGRRGAF